MKPFLACTLFFLYTSLSAQKHDIERWLKAADSCIEIKKYQQAFLYLDSVLTTDPDNIEAYERGLFIYSDLDDYPHALAVCKNLLLLKPADAAYNNNAGWFALLTGDFMTARQFLNTSITLDDNNYSALLNMGHVFNCTGNLEQAEYYYGKAIEFLPNAETLERGPVADFRLLKKLGFSQLDTTSLIRLFRNNFQVFAKNTRSSAIMDSVYLLTYSFGIPASDERVISLKKRFCMEEQKYQTWRYSVLMNFYWDAGVAEYKKRNTTRAIDDHLKTSMNLGSQVGDTLWMIRKLIATSALETEPSFSLLYAALQLSKATNDLAWQIRSCNALFSGYADKYRPDSSLKYAAIAYSLSQQLAADDEGEFQNGIAWIRSICSYDLVNAFSALRICDSVNYYSDKYENYSGLTTIGFKEALTIDEGRATAFYKCGKYQQALDQIESILTTYTYYTIDLSGVYQLQGLCYYQQDKMKQAETAFLHAIGSYDSYTQKKPGDKEMSVLNIHCVTAIEYLKKIYVVKRDVNALYQLAERSKQSAFYAQLTGYRSPVNILELSQLQSKLKDGEVAIDYSSSGDMYTGYAIAVTNKKILLMTENKIAFAIAAKDSVVTKSFKDMEELVTYALKATGRQALEEEDKIKASLAVVVVQLNRLIGNYKNSRSTIRSGEKKSDISKERVKAWSRLLYDLYVSPFDEVLKDAKKLYISSEMISEFIPFEALQNKEGKYLGELYNIVYAPSFTILQLMKQFPENNSGNLLAVGDPMYSSFTGATMNGRAYDLAQWGYGNWGDLPGTKKEMEELKKISPNVTIIEGREVNESNIASMSQIGKLKNYSYLHFALHGMSMLNSYQDNSLILTEPPNTAQDGFLQFKEIAGLDLNARLVCLSACETAVAGYDEQNMYSLPMAFILAGAKSVIGTSWVVDDEATVIFMRELYTKVLQQHMEPSEALFRTKQQFIRGEIKEEYKSPAYWAAFKLYGD